MTYPRFLNIIANLFGLTDVGLVAAPTFADIDGDGDLDAFVGNNSGNTLFYQNTGTVTNPQFAAPSTNPFGLTNVGLYAAPTFADIDGDGDLDAFVGNRSGNTLFYQNTGTATNPQFAALTTNPFGLTNVGLYAAPTFADIDGDGDLDAFVGNLDGNILFYRNIGTASNTRFADPSTNPFGLTDVGFNAKPTFADIDGDGDLDAFVGNLDGNTLFYRNIGTATNPQFASPTTNPFGLTDVGLVAAPTFADIDGDGDLDAFVGNLDGNTNFSRNQPFSSPNINFHPPTTYPFGVTDVGLYASPTLVDIDGDGDLDAFVGNFDGNTLFYRNIGTATNPQFNTPTTNPFGLTDVGYLASPTFADIDGDGDLDAFVGNFDGNILFYRNIGTATNPQFASPTTNPFGLTDVGYFAAPTLADIDGDGDLDAFVGNLDGNTLFYRNIGTANNPQFAAPTTNSFGLTDVGYFAAPTFADLDGDGDLDAFVGEGEGNTLFYRNTGTARNPQFVTPSTNPFGLADVGRYAKPTFADIDGDGNLDAFVGNGDGNTNFSQNQPAFPPSINFLPRSTNPFGLTPLESYSTPTFADIDGDGDLDAFVGNRDGNILFYRNIGTATKPQFDTPTPNSFGLTDVGFYAAPTLVDIDGDGDLDAFVGNSEGNTLFYRNIGTATNPQFAAPTTNPFGLTDVGYLAKPTFADIDGDGDLDAFVGNRDGNILFYRNIGTATNPQFASPTTNPFGLTGVGSFAAPTFADIDGDGDLDAFVINVDSNILFYRNIGTASNPQFDTPTPNSFGLTDVGLNAALTFADIDGDGDLDAFVGERYGDTAFYQNQPAPPTPINFRPPSTNSFGLTDVGFSAVATLADIDGDGDLDAFVGNFDGNILLYRNTGTATNPQFATPINNPFGLTDVGFNAAPTFADIDGDGDLDAFVGHFDGNTMFYRNTGTATNPQFAAPTNNPFGLSDVGFNAVPTFADIDGDGDLDVFVGNFDGNILLYRNTGTATNPQFAAPTTNPFGLTNVGTFAKPTFADIDGDGDLDAFVGNGDGNTLFYRNTGTATNPQFNTPTTNPFGLTDVRAGAAPTLVDIDGDGDLDTFVGNSDGNTLFFLNIPNTPPTAANDAVSINENTLLNGNVLTNDSDLDGSPLTVTQVNGSAANVGQEIILGNGKLRVNANGSFTFDPTNGTPALTDGYDYLAQGVTATASFTYTISDGNGGTANATTIITITGVNDVATITGTATGTVTEDASTPNLTTTGTLTVTDVDTGENNFNTTIAGTGNIGSLTITTAGTWNYTVANSAVQSLGAGDSKTETFTVQSVDGTASQEITVTINGVNDHPIASDDNRITNFNTPLFIPVSDLLLNDSDIDGDSLSIINTLNATNGTAVLNNGVIEFTPTTDFIGNASFDYTVSDGFGGTDIGTVTVTVQSNRIIGTPGNNNLTGTASNDLIEGLEGNDTLDGGAGNLDRIFGGDGDDRITDSDGVNGAHGSPGNDVINITFAASWDNDTNPNNAPRSDGKITGGFGNDVITVTMNNSNFFINLKGDEPTSNQPQDGNDVVTLLGSYAHSVVDMGGGNDIFNGGVGNDNVSGHNGNDTLNGNAGNDTLYGGAGLDWLDGGTGADMMVGGSGMDIYFVDNPQDIIIEEADGGIDTVIASISWQLGSHLENLTLTGTNAINGTGNSSNNVLIGNSAGNILSGGNGNDWLSGLGGNDRLLGENGNDTLLGGNGDDVLVGGLGSDVLNGGDGSDRFVYNTISDRGTLAAGDTINGFSTISDKLDLTQLLPTLIGYSGNVLGYLQFTQSGANALVQIDADGGGNSFVNLSTLTNVSAASLVVGTNVLV
ncbi:VCBS repeat-containing protein [Nostoc sp. PCC 7524]|uniref:FG-GAP-like repeat-containing protein n=1 Tax=Nostoc sp. (strain ATCC 29411 / PCC 7524) TaxID=28072 RepID=UPI00029EC5E9|nr:FG-GAP-like repeat-containing protein [Nostoc sp. PCC 7524]AFY45959.1 VCBS repeat-containing protein [Nostoc sp. PCC 7524]